MAIRVVEFSNGGYNKVLKQPAQKPKVINRQPFQNSYIQGISITVIGTFGFVANILSVHVLLRCRENRNFHRLLAGLTIVDTVLIG